MKLSGWRWVVTVQAAWSITAAGVGSHLARAGETAPESRPVTSGEAEFFERRIRPVLVEHCVVCHGPTKQKAGIRLDSRPSLMQGNGSGPLLEPGAPEDSVLIDVVRRTGPIKMPPTKGLGPDAVADLTTWVKMGAPWPEPSHAGTPGSASADVLRAKGHWAFHPVGNPLPPEVRRREWPRASIDRYVLAALEGRGLSPSPPADRRTLLRRAAFDLTGLPPTEAEVAAFEADRSSDAFARVVDRLLASPRYGERWGRLWLDVARYADTKGYILFEKTEYPWAYTYRDYVIDAFNRDLPYDQFLIEQLAADLLPPRADKHPLRALGFVTLGSRFMNNVHDVIDDRIDVVTRGLLGLTVACARCHDHKFDPIPTRDYYSLYGVFASSVEPPIPPLFADPPRTARYAAFVKELQAREDALAGFVKARHDELVTKARTRAAEYLVAAQASLGQPTTEEFMLLADASDLNPVMTGRWRSYLERTRRRHHPVFAPWNALADLPAEDFPARARTLCDQWARTANPSRPINPLIARALVEHPPRSLAEAAETYARLLNSTERLWQESASRAALNGAVATELPVPAHEELRQVFHGPDAAPALPFDPYGSLTLFPDRPSQAAMRKLLDAVETWKTTGPGAPPRAMTLTDLAEPVEPRVFVRGNAHNLGDRVPRRFLEVLSGPDRTPFRSGSGRLELARAIASRDNPLTARVLVNRVWMHHFGTPLVATPSDFGLRSEPPSHPELLDHLASVFMEGGWSIKALHRRIVLSSAYQQSSDDRPECRQADPENRLLWRMNRRRLDFESTRDALLAVSGRLAESIGGPSVPDLTAGSTPRRSVYGFIDRHTLPSLYRSFDFPDPNATSARRDTTTIAPQALYFMNHPFVMESARSLVQRPAVSAARTDRERIERIYGVLFQRKPREDEVDAGRSFLAEDGAGPERWDRYAQALFMTNEFLFVD